MNPELAKVREWAQAQLDALEEPSWATGRYHHLIQAIDRMLAAQTPKATDEPRRGNIVNICSARRSVAGQRR